MNRLRSRSCAPSERANDPKLAQRLLEVIEQMHQDADALRSIDDEIASGVIRCQ